MTFLPQVPWERVRRRFLWMPGFWTALIVGLHAIPGEDAALEGWYALFHIDKVLHALFFGSWGLSVQIALGKSGALRGMFLGTLGVGLLFGLGLEWAQGALFSGRRMDLYDVVADGVGVALGHGVFLWLYRGCFGMRPISFRHRS